MKKLIGYLKYLSLFILLLTLSSCSDKFVNKNPVLKKSNELNDGRLLTNANYACYEIPNLNTELKEGWVFYPTKTPTQDTQEIQNNCKPMNEAIKTKYSNRPVVIISHGWNGDRTSFLNQIKNFVQMGMVVMVYTTTKHANLINDPTNWTLALEDMLFSLETENKSKGSPIHGKVNMNNINLMAHSMGGGGLFHLFEKRQDLKINSVIAVTPWAGLEKSQLSANKVNAKSFLILSGKVDLVAPVNHQEFYYSLLPENIQKAWATIAKTGHLDFGSASTPEKAKVLDKYLIDWFKIWVFGMQKDKTMYKKPVITQLKNKKELLRFEHNLFN